MCGKILYVKKFSLERIRRTALLTSPPIRRMENTMAKIMDSIKGFFGKCADWFKEKTKNVKWKEVWDKCTTGLLILLMASPIFILAYIFLWFAAR